MESLYYLSTRSIHTFLMVTIIEKVFTMPEMLKYKNYPRHLLEYPIEPFREAYIPGAVVLCREGAKGDEVFFQISTPKALTLPESKKEEIRKEIHGWWQNKEIAE